MIAALGFWLERRFVALRYISVIEGKADLVTHEGDLLPPPIDALRRDHSIRITACRLPRFAPSKMRST
jgi:hypothetical protein